MLYLPLGGFFYKPSSKWSIWEWEGYLLTPLSPHGETDSWIHKSKQSVLSSDIPSSEICPPLMSISMAYYFLGVSTLCILDVIFRQILTFLEDQLCYHGLWEHDSINYWLRTQSINNLLEMLQIIKKQRLLYLLIQLLGAIHIMGCEHTWLPLIYITRYWLSLYALSIPTVKFVSEPKKCVWCTRPIPGPRISCFETLKKNL